MGILAMDDADRVTDWQEKPKQPKSDLASMGVYVFSKRALRRWLQRGPRRLRRQRHPGDARRRRPRLSATASAATGRTSGTIQSYWEANLALLEDRPELDLYDRDWVIHTRSEERAPAKVGATAQIHRSLISHGCVIDGTVVNSVLSPGVRVDVGAVVRDSIVMFDSVIRAGAVVDRAILDKEVVVGQGAIVGEGPYDGPPNRQEPGRLNTGITVVGKQSIVPRGGAARAQRQGRRRREEQRLRDAASCRPVARSIPRPPRSAPRPAPPSRDEAASAS